MPKKPWKRIVKGGVNISLKQHGKKNVLSINGAVTPYSPFKEMKLLILGIYVR